MANATVCVDCGRPAARDNLCPDCWDRNADRAVAAVIAAEDDPDATV